MSLRFLSFGRFWRAAVAVVLGVVALSSASCSTTSTPPKYFTQFYMEAAGQSGVAFTLPVSGLEFRRQPQPFLTAADVLWVQPGSVNVQGVPNACVFFQFTIQGQHELYIHTGNNVGRRIFLFANDKPIAVRYIDQVLQTEPLFMFLEASDEKAFTALVTDLQDSQKQVLALKKKL